MRRSIPILWGLVIILLIFDFLLLDTLNLARLTAIETLSKVETTLDSLANEVITYNVTVNQAVPVKVDVPFNRTMEIPLDTVIPIDQELAVPFSMGGREIKLNVPIKGDFPINTVVPVNFNETITVNTVVQLNTTMPVEIDIAQTSLAGYLQRVKQDISRLRNKLALQSDMAAAAETTAIIAVKTVPQPKLEPTSTLPVEVTNEIKDNEVATPPAAGGQISTPVPAGDIAPLDKILAQSADLGRCGHAYWPLSPGTKWTFNSPDTSYSLLVDNVTNNQVKINTAYENQSLQFGLECYQEGLGGNFLGDMRRLTALGNLNFGNPRGMFLPRPEVIENIGQAWTQEYEVSGAVEASHGNRPVMGQIKRGRVMVVYTPTGVEILTTLQGPRKAIRLEQKLNLELSLDFDLAGQVIPATEIVKLTNLYWFVKDIGPVKIQWQGGIIQQDFKISSKPFQQQVAVPALAEEQLVFLCAQREGKSSECTRLAGLSQADLTAPPKPELVIPRFIFPDDINNSSSTVETITPVITERSSATHPPQAQPTATASNNEQLALVAYAQAVANLGKKITEAGQEFGQDALAYRNDELTPTQFRDKFLLFIPKVQEPIRGINQLTPPPKAQTIHATLISGLNQCNEAIGLMDKWFETHESGIKETATLLVASCMNQVETARNELKTLADEN